MKLAIVGIVVVALVVGRRMYLAWQVSLHAETREHPLVPESLREGAERTWVVFTTPFCATCEPVKASLAAADPSARVVTVDATREPHLADAFHVRSAPTAILADAAGEVMARLVGAAAVSKHFAATV
ncbi:MAG: thioredoxin family protein [Acidimicrobiales bacterium]